MKKRPKPPMVAISAEWPRPFITIATHRFKPIVIRGRHYRPVPFELKPGKHSS